jgi:hypothetical protein
VLRNRYGTERGRAKEVTFLKFLGSEDEGTRKFVGFCVKDLSSIFTAELGCVVFCLKPSVITLAVDQGFNIER